VEASSENWETAAIIVVMGQENVAGAPSATTTRSRHLE